MPDEITLAAARPKCCDAREGKDGCKATMRWKWLATFTDGIWECPACGATEKGWFFADLLGFDRSIRYAGSA